MSAHEFLAELKALAAEATPGEWVAVSARFGYDVSETWAVEPSLPSVHNVCHVTVGQADAEFIAHSRAAVPRLVAALEAVLNVHLDTDSFGSNINRIDGYQHAIRDVRRAIEEALGGAE